MSDDTHTHHADKHPAGTHHLVAGLRRMRAHLSRYLARPPDHPAPQGPEDPVDLARRYGQPISHLRQYIEAKSILSSDSPALTKIYDQSREMDFAEPDPLEIVYQPVLVTHYPTPHDPQRDSEDDSQ